MSSAPSSNRGSKRATAKAEQTADRARQVAVGAIVLAVLLLVAFLTTGGGDDGDAAGANEYGVVIGGESLPELPASGADPAVGMQVPNTTGQGISGETVNPTNSGRAKAILFVAHWCPHCQREVPAVQEWVDDDGLPDDVGLYAVSTAEEASRDNSDVEGWLEAEGWTAPTLRDVDGTAAEAYGVTGFPFWVFVDAEDTVVARHSGELPIDQLAATVDQLSS